MKTFNRFMAALMLTAILAPVGYYAYLYNAAHADDAWMATYCGPHGNGYGSSTCEDFNAQR